MEHVTQYCIGLEDEPGSLAGLCAAFRESGANIESVFVTYDTEGCWVHVTAQPQAAAEQALRKGHYTYVAEKVIKIPLTNHIGELERVAHRLAEEKINIDYVYGSGCPKTPFTLVLSTEETERAARVLDEFAIKQ